MGPKDKEHYIDDDDVELLQDDMYIDLLTEAMTIEENWNDDENSDENRILKEFGY